MSDTRRSFIHSTATVAAGLIGASPSTPAQESGQARRAVPVVDSEVRIPEAKLGKIEISRLILGVNPFYGFAHFNSTYALMMREWYSPAKVLEVLHRCETYGISAYNYVHMGRAFPDWEKYKGEGGGMHLVAQATTDDPAVLVNAVHPVAAWVQGERTDDAYRAGKLDSIRDYCQKMRDLGVQVVGVGSHIPEVLAMVEEQGWDVDFYAGCVYNRRRTREELRALLGGELPEMPNEVYLQDDPERMYRVFRKTSKPCVAFKIMAAGRVRNPELAFKRAFERMKPNDFVCVGMFPCAKDEVRENAEVVTRLLKVS